MDLARALTPRHLTKRFTAAVARACIHIRLTAAPLRGRRRSDFEFENAWQTSRNAWHVSVHCNALDHFL